MVLFIGTQIFVYSEGTSSSPLCTKAKWSLSPTSTSRILAESRTVKPVAYFTSTASNESHETTSSFPWVLAFLFVHAQNKAVIAKKKTVFFISFVIISFLSAKLQNIFVLLHCNSENMQTKLPEVDSASRCHWYNRLWASFIFFTRLPFWRLHEPPKESYESVVEYWPLTGWLTGGLMAATVWVGSMYLPYMIAVLLAIVVRLLVTGALHEDGLADFLDGFGGGGSDRERILTIMKDSHIGTYGVIGLIMYELLLAATLLYMPPSIAALGILAATPYARMVTAQLIMMMPYARREEEAKAKTVYRKMSWGAGVSLTFQGLLPIIAFLWYTGLPWEMVIFIPCVVMYFLYLLIWHKLRGYTGDCCGAVCLLVELTTLLVICAQSLH